MGSVLKQPVTAIWLVLMIATVASTWWFSSDSVAPAAGTVVVIAIAGLKVGFVMSDFMGLRRAPLPWIVAGAVWLVAATATILIVYTL